MSIGFDLCGERCAFKLQGCQLGVDGFVQLLCGFCARRRKSRRGVAVTHIGFISGRFELLQLLRAGIDQRDIGGVFRGQRGEPIDRRRIFAGSCAQCEQPFLDALEFCGVEISRGNRCGEMLVGLLQRVDRGVDRLDRRLDQGGRIGGPALQPAHCRRQRRHRRMIAADRLLRLAQIGCDLLALHHRGAPFGEHGFLAVLGRQRFQFLGCMAQIIRLARGAFHAGAMFVECCVGGAP